MDPAFGEEQKILRESAGKFLEKECDMQSVREAWEDETGYSSILWNKMAELGWIGLKIPEQYGGMDMTFVDLGVLLEEMGRAAAPGPFLSTVLAAQAIIEAGSEEQKMKYLPLIAAGKIRATLALWEPQYCYGPAGIHMVARPQTDGFHLTGTKLFVMDGHVSELMVVAARTKKGENPEEGITLFLLDRGVAEISTQLLESLDGGRKQSAVVFQDLWIPSSRVLGEADRGWPVLNRILNKGAVAVSLESVGGGRKTLEMTVDYAKIRVQFDRPIGGFQAIKHKCAEMMAEVEGAASIAYYAAWAIDQGGVEAEIGASLAKAYCSEMYRNVTAEATQIHGAIALTWEHDLHIYLKRAKMNEWYFGDPIFHKEKLAGILGY
jgi:alkylation response protein AidB-like acyl-CoA dehydrogenase